MFEQFPQSGDEEPEEDRASVETTEQKAAESVEAADGSQQDEAREEEPAALLPHCEDTVHSSISDVIEAIPTNREGVKYGGLIPEESIAGVRNALAKAEIKAPIEDSTIGLLGAMDADQIRNLVDAQARGISMKELSELRLENRFISEPMKGIDDVAQETELMRLVQDLSKMSFSDAAETVTVYRMGGLESRPDSEVLSFTTDPKPEFGFDLSQLGHESDEFVAYTVKKEAVLAGHLFDSDRTSEVFVRPTDVTRAPSDVRVKSDTEAERPSPGRRRHPTKKL